MAAGLHRSARTTPRVRAELQAAQASTRALAAQYGLNPKTVAKWRARQITADAPMGPRQPRSTVLTEAEEATIKAFHYPNLDALRVHVLTFVQAYNFAKHLKALQWRTLFQAICDAWTKDPSSFKIKPHHLIPGPHT